MSIPPEKNGSRSSISYWFAAGTISRISWRSAKSARRRPRRLVPQSHWPRPSRRFCRQWPEAPCPARAAAHLSPKWVRSVWQPEPGNGRRRRLRQKKASLKEAATLKSPSPRLTPNPSVLLPGSPRPKIRRKKAQLPEIWKALPVGSRQYPRKKTDASPISRQIVFPKAAEGLPSTTMHMSVNAMTMQRRTLSACWTRWRRRLPASSWRMNGHGNSTMWPRASPMEMSMLVLISV